jgi:hypothetical protein
MTDKILQILDNVRYWETYPDDYKKYIQTFLETQNQVLHIQDVIGRSEQLPCKKCGDYGIVQDEHGNNSTCTCHY